MTHIDEIIHDSRYIPRWPTVITAKKPIKLNFFGELVPANAKPPHSRAVKNRAPVIYEPNIGPGYGSEAIAFVNLVATANETARQTTMVLDR